MREVISWAHRFPVYEAPPWLPSRIVANTPRRLRESWLETLRLAGQWIVQPRTAMAIFTATLVLGWLGSLAGISPDWSAIVRNPAAVYYQGQATVNCMYQGAVRAYYESPLAAEIEQLMEIS
jgi:hypothetical protein